MFAILLAALVLPAGILAPAIARAEVSRRAEARESRSEPDTIRIPVVRADVGSIEAEAETVIIQSRRGKGPRVIDLGRHGKISVDPGDEDRGDRVVMGDDLTIDEDDVVTGDAVSLGGDVLILGKVMGSVVSVGGEVELGDSAFVGGDAVSVGGGVSKSETAIVTGQTVEVGVTGPLPFIIGKKAPGSHKSAGSRFASFLGTIIFYLALFAFAALAVFLGRHRIEYASDYLSREPLPSLVLGLVSPVLLLIAFILLCITLIGIPVAAALVLLYPAFIFLGWVVAGHRIGRSLRPGELPLKTVFTGLVVLSGLHLFQALLKAIGVGGFVNFTLGFAGLTIAGLGAFSGLGAILGTRFRRPPVAPAPGSAGLPGGPMGGMSIDPMTMPPQPMAPPPAYPPPAAPQPQAYPSASPGYPTAPPAYPAPPTPQPPPMPPPIQ